MALDDDILAALAGGPLHGYAIRCSIRERTGKTISAARLYEAIARLKSGGLIRRTYRRVGDTEKVRYHWRLTENGARLVTAAPMVTGRVEHGRVVLRSEPG